MERGGLGNTVRANRCGFVVTILEEAAFIRGEIEAPHRCYRVEPSTRRRLKALVAGL